MYKNVTVMYHYRFINIQKLVNHLQENHSISIHMEALEFESFDQFISWKEKEETNTHSWYVQHCAPLDINGKEHWYFYCNRSGKYSQRGKGERGMKSQGTSKTISHCSAHIKAIRDIKTDQVSVQYTSTHYNHNTQLCHLRIPNSTRMMIASKLKKGITTERIIDDIRDFSETKHISRKHLVSRKDITNIQKQYNIEGIRKHPNDLISVYTIIEEMETLDYNPIVLFKQQGELPSDLCKNLSKQRFFACYSNRVSTRYALQTW